MSLLKEKNLISTLRQNVEDYDGEIIFLKGSTCGGKTKCSGIFYFDSEDRPIIKVATNKFKNKQEWLGTLVHEYCHFEQWKNNIRVWSNYDANGVPLENILWTPKKFKKELIDMINLELDCEKKAVKIISKNQLFNISKYIITANAVLFKYVYAYHFGKWPEKSIKSKEILDICPQKLLKSAEEYLNFYRNLNKIGRAHV